MHPAGQLLLRPVRPPGAGRDQVPLHRQPRPQRDHLRQRHHLDGHRVDRHGAHRAHHQRAAALRHNVSLTTQKCFTQKSTKLRWYKTFFPHN